MRTLEQEIAVGLRLGETPEQLASRVRSHIEQERVVELMEKKGELESLASIDLGPEPTEQEITALGKLLAQGTCAYPDCDCAVSFSVGYRPSSLTECPRFMDEIGGFDALTD